MNEKTPLTNAQTGTAATHDPSEVDLKVILVFLGIVVVIVAMVFAGIKMSNRLMENKAQANDQAQASLSVLPEVAASRHYFPQPTEQISPHANWVAFKAREDAEMNSYGWVNQKAGVARIPVSRAMVMLIEQMAASNAPASTGQGTSLLNLQEQRVLQSGTNIEEITK